jgi:ribosomal protein L11 methyltransferase
LGKRYPAIDIRSEASDTVLVALDDFSPIAIEERDDFVRVFFAAAKRRDDASHALGAAGYHVEAVEVDDDNWARRSQEALEPITVGQITVVSRPPGSDLGPHLAGGRAPLSDLTSVLLVIQPSMGFGTGHHASTRLCLTGLQAIEVGGRSVLDVGTGSGILAIAAARLGAARVTAIDIDPDAIQSAAENLSLNPDAVRVTFHLADIRSANLGPVDVITANLTAALLAAAAADLRRALTPGGILIASGVLDSQREQVIAAYHPVKIIWEACDEEWVGFALRFQG